MVCVSQELQDEERKALADILLVLAEIRESRVSFLHAKRNSKQIRDGATLVIVVALINTILIYKRNASIAIKLFTFCKRTEYFFKALAFAVQGNDIKVLLKG